MQMPARARVTGAAERRCARGRRRCRSEFARRIRDRYAGLPQTGSDRDRGTRPVASTPGRVGRSADARRFDRDAIALAVGAHVRHVHTEYDQVAQRGLGEA